MNITEETNDYFSTTNKIKSGGIIVRNPIFKMGKNPDLENDYCNANSGPTEKLKTRNICLYGAPEWLFKMLFKKKK